MVGREVSRETFRSLSISRHMSGELLLDAIPVWTLRCRSCSSKLMLVTIADGYMLAKVDSNVQQPICLELRHRMQTLPRSDLLVCVLLPTPSTVV